MSNSDRERDRATVELNTIELQKIEKQALHLERKIQKKNSTQTQRSVEKLDALLKKLSFCEGDHEEKYDEKK